MMFEVGAWNKTSEKRRKRGRLYMWLYVRRLRVVTRFVSLVFLSLCFSRCCFHWCHQHRPGLMNIFSVYVGRWTVITLRLF